MKKIIYLGMVAATMFCGCRKHEPVEPEPIVIPPNGEIEIVFNQDQLKPVTTEAIQEILNSKDAATIRTIYLVPEEGTWSNFSTVSLLRTRVLEPTLKLSPKVKGKGDFNFKPGWASKVPEDSLWYVQHGWTINKRFLENQ